MFENEKKPIIYTEFILALCILFTRMNDIHHNSVNVYEKDAKQYITFFSYFVVKISSFALINQLFSAITLISNVIDTSKMT